METGHHLPRQQPGHPEQLRLPDRLEGRVVHAEGELILRTGHRNKAQQVYSGGGDRIYQNPNPRDNDAGGHLFGTQFGGAGEGLNMVPQAARQNSGGDWQAMEKDWADALEADKDVYVKVVPKYPNDSTHRPHEFEISYTIRSVDENGKLVIQRVRRTIPNA
nr:DNA/RNA non-specific endonuclease [Actinopolymorpha pittospori]